jgi:hypothetical protein
MLMSDKDCVQRFRGASNLGEPLADLATAKPSIDQNARLVCFQISTVTPGATS